MRRRPPEGMERNVVVDHLAQTTAQAADDIVHSGAGGDAVGEENEVLAANLERAIQQKTRHGVRNLRVEIAAGRITLSGRCATYYGKQLAQGVVMESSAHDLTKELINNIEVV